MDQRVGRPVSRLQQWSREEPVGSCPVVNGISRGGTKQMFERHFEGKGEKNVKGNEKMAASNKNGKS